ncbi:MerR family transcriptional regulator [Gordonia soli]|uniref:Putative MerR family transcriptional regulator n=1 Tax=Gordonia soli NBRC 108243 TaxID=1223545 RepID=M0QMS3_9ACTN|nr:MerR family transcriptional regulator [Gordonia soli]GAC69950.1 putative MerR family transcriptional regulator [Gordonia soli NBRC 108243]
MVQPRPQQSVGAVYSISVAAERSGVGLQTLRLYERRGLLLPARTQGGTRRYSEDDLLRLGRITRLVRDGVNLAAVGLILQLEDENANLRLRLDGGDVHAAVST